MDLKVQEKTDSELSVELVGESHGLPNMLKGALLNDERVELASYNIEHPLDEDPVLFLRTKEGEDPLNVLEEVAKDLRGDLKGAIEST